MGYAQVEIKPVKVERNIKLPTELVEALDADSKLAGAFHNLTPGRQRSYVINIACGLTIRRRKQRSSTR